MDFNRTWSLQQIQDYVEQVRYLRKGDEPKANAEDCLLHLLEEVGELTREIRRRGAHQSVSNELADCLFYLAALASELKVDLGDALYSKEKLNRIRFGV